MMFRLMGVMLLCGSFCVGVLAGETGSWGDQGDGTYRNPILNADYPDVDVEQLGDTYYMISSKQHMSSGHGHSAVQGHGQLAHVGARVGQAERGIAGSTTGTGWTAIKFGVWAGDLAYHDGRWYCYQIDFTAWSVHEQCRKTSDGPWTEPHPMMLTSKTHWTDPAVLLG